LHNFNFPKTNRILKHNEFLLLSKKGKRVKNRYFTIVYSESLSGTTRLGLTVSKKTGNSVVRNKIKRRIREYFRINKCSFKRKWDINVIAKPETGNLKTALFIPALNDVFRKIEEGLDN
jgi:ribonuclease P protein component